MSRKNQFAAGVAALLCLLCVCPEISGTPANKAALAKHFDRFLSANLNRCVTCHLPSDHKNPESLAEFPHNSFGDHLRQLGEQLRKDNKPAAISDRLKLVTETDSDGDGAADFVELLLGSNPGDTGDKPADIALFASRKKEFDTFLAAYRWQPFSPVTRPPVPELKGSSWVRNPIDAFIAAEHARRGLTPHPEAEKEQLMRRVYLDLVGLNPTVEEQDQFLNDQSSDAYERLVDRLLEDKRYGERWGRHWMDVWRYSDWAGWTDGNQVRDSKPHIWRWKEWIIESLNSDKPYHQMVLEMLAADELTPADPDALRATGYLVRNFKLLSREQWLEDTIKHTSQAFMGVTIGCAKCHDHMYDPITQAEYYQMRAIFEPHDVRTDRVPGELDRNKSGLVRAYDKDLAKATYFFLRGDERKPDTNRVIAPGVPAVLDQSGFSKAAFAVQTVALPSSAAFPDKRPFVLDELLKQSSRELEQVRALLAAEKKPESRTELLFKNRIAETKHEGLVLELEAERLADAGQKDTEEYRAIALQVFTVQKEAAVLQSKLDLHLAEAAIRNAQLAEGAAKRMEAEDAAKAKTEASKAGKDLQEATKKADAARKALATAQAELEAIPTAEFKARPAESYPTQSSGRRLAFARWLADARHPLTARVAANHIWLRHFGRGIVPNPADFGGNASGPTHPELLDWLAAEFMAQGWSMKKLHRLILTSSTYRMGATPDNSNLAIDPDNHFLWRMNSRRLDAELVRDNLLHVAGNMDYAMGGPDIPHTEGLTSRRRSLYLRLAAEKEVEFLKIFDGPAVTECYQRHTTVMPQQALALANSELALNQARVFASSLASSKSPEEFVQAAYRRALARFPKPEELSLCLDFLRVNSFDARARENLALVLFNHSDFITVR